MRRSPECVSSLDELTSFPQSTYCTPQLHISQSASCLLLYSPAPARFSAALPRTGLTLISCHNSPRHSSALTQSLITQAQPPTPSFFSNERLTIQPATCVHEFCVVPSVDTSAFSASWSSNILQKQMGRNFRCQTINPNFT